MLEKIFGKEKKLVMCQNCRALVDPSASVCPMCGNESVPDRPASVTNESTGFFSKLILAINVLLFLGMAAVGMRNDAGMESILQGASWQVLLDFGALEPSRVWRGEWWRLVTANFLHIGLMHLMFNSVALFQIGPLVEEIFGEQKFITIYLCTGIAGITAALLLNWPGAGASAAIYGLIGLLAAYGYRLGGAWGKSLMRQMLIWAAIGTVFGLMVGVNHAAHGGGFVGGVVLGLLLKGEAPTTASSQKLWNFLAVGSVLLVVGSFVLVGINYGASQSRQESAQAIIRLSRVLNQARNLATEPLDPNAPNELSARAQSLRLLITDINSVKQIDARSTEIRGRLVAGLTRRVEVFERVGQQPQSALPITPEEFAAETRALEETFRDYRAWERSVVQEYGLVYTNER